MAKYRPLVRKKHVYKFNTTKRNEQDRQSERMYSEEDMIEFAKYCNLKDDTSVRELLVIWFKVFKKK
jgi:hypothetical protein